jgi:hypothetical protein
MLSKAAFIDGSDLFQKDHRILAQTYAASGNIYVCRKTSFSCLTGDGCSDYRWGMAVSGVILNNKNGSGTSLLTANYR